MRRTIAIGILLWAASYFSPGGYAQLGAIDLKRPITYQFKVDLDLNKLNGISSTLHALREDEEEYCTTAKNRWDSERNHTLPFFICSWHRPVPTVLQNVLTVGIPDEIGDVHAPPYKPFSLQRRQLDTTMKSLASVEEVESGTTTFRQWNEDAADGRLFNCIDPDSANTELRPIPDNMARFSHQPWLTPAAFTRNTVQRSLKKAQSCLVVVRNEGEQGITFLALCQVITVGRQIGAPEECMVIAADAKSQHWIMAETASYYILLAMNGRPDFTYNIFYQVKPTDASVHSGLLLRSEDLSRAIEKALSSPPLNMQTSSNGYVIGIIDEQSSKVMPGHPFETVTVTVFIKDDPVYEDRKIISHDYGLTVSTTVLLNTQNTDNPYNYHPASFSQNKIWADAVRARLQQEILVLCPHANRRDDFALTCSND
jgi:hypothetical protein